MTFEEFGLSEDVMQGIEAMNFQEMTPVQEQTIPVSETHVPQSVYA